MASLTVLVIPKLSTVLLMRWMVSLGNSIKRCKDDLCGRLKGCVIARKVFLFKDVGAV